jgi:hypothetical protein
LPLVSITIRGQGRVSREPNGPYGPLIGRAPTLPLSLCVVT